MTAIGNGTDIQKKVLIVDEDGFGQRMDSHLASNLPAHMSRSRVKSLIKEGNVTVNGLRNLEPNYRLKLGDQLEFMVPEPEAAEPEPEDIPLSVLYEDDHLIVIDKPSGLVVHPAVGNWSGTLVNALLFHCGDSLSGIGGVRRPGIVHRLDKDTSGVMVVAKNDQAHAGLSEQFADHGRSGNLERAYLALVWGQLPRMAGTIDTYLGRSTNNRLKRAVVESDTPDAKHARTHYKVLKTFGDAAGGDALASLVECRLETGRTHQIRVHLAEIGHPLLGDDTYGAAFKSKENVLPHRAQIAVRKLNRQALHAHLLGFTHPVSSEKLAFQSPIPIKFEALLDALVQTGSKP